jgi:peptidoglycan/LPS O-acetylase OafA/YrhL
LPETLAPDTGESISRWPRNEMNKRIFDVSSTDACKGVALMFLLWHHLFHHHPEFGFTVHQTAKFARVCVAIFVLLSGYGYAESIKRKDVGLLQFYKHRFVAIYSNYWLIALIFVPIGVFCFGRTLESAFTNHAYIKFLIQMTGLHMQIIGEYGYNPTWWYMSIIIPLIFLFPFLYDAVKKYGLLVLLCFLFILIPNSPIVPDITRLAFAFSLGIYLSQRNVISIISVRLSALGWRRHILLLVITVLIMLFRSNSPLLNGSKIDWLFGLLIILHVFELTIEFPRIVKPLGWLGKHLFNVFLFHTFIYFFFWKDFIYSFKQPILIFIVLLLICVALSEMIEYFKKAIGFYKITNKLQGFKISPSMEISFPRKWLWGLRDKRSV